MLLLLITSINFASASLAITPTPRYVIHIMADDLGYGDVGWRTRTTEKVQTPTLDRLVAEGVEIPEHYSYKMCSPSRVSLLTGRYPYHAGYYNNNGGDTEGAPIEYTLLPAQLKKAGWSTHALGKWHAGWAFTNYTPTYRGFDTYLGSSGNLDGYWGSLSGGHCLRDTSTDSLLRFDGFDEDWAAAHPKKVAAYRRAAAYGVADTDAGLATDLIRGVGRNVTVAQEYRSNPNVYDARMYTAEASALVAQHDVARGFYLYMAFHNVHVPIQFPLATAERYPHVATDARKGTDAQLTELDWTVGNISAALARRGMLEDTLWIFHSDNGGPGSHAVNAPHRGGKFSFWEGGVRTAAFVSWKGLAPAMRGTKLKGLAHLTDWYVTVVQGIAKIDLTSTSTSTSTSSALERAMPGLDGYNLWPAITGAAASSPRREVVHMPSSNAYNNASVCRKGPGHGCSPAIRVGDLKLIVGWPGADNLWSYDDRAATPTPFGKSGGTCVNETQCTAPHWKQQHPGKGQGSTCTPYCLFNVSMGADLGEEHDLAKDSGKGGRYEAQARAMLRRLDEEAQTGLPLAYIPGAEAKTVGQTQCDLFAMTGFWLPSDMPGYTPKPPPPTPTPPPTPVVIPPACEKAMEKICPRKKGEGFKTCRACCHAHVDVLGPGGAKCKPKDYSAYCGGGTSTVW